MSQEISICKDPAQEMYYIKVDGRNVFFLCERDIAVCENCQFNCECTHTRFIEKSNYIFDPNNLNGFITYFEKIFEEGRFEKLYFDDTSDDFDYWEREKIWNCRTNEWEVENAETSNN